ncbi:Rad1/Rec1/Rad17 [Kalaharituber pfeilii]|nr:Rad1/Rec1/Rad17 [Kalaharituber pfeilii]
MHRLPAMSAAAATPPCFSAVTSSARQLFSILRCVGFAPRAQVQISTDGIRVSVEDSRVMQGSPHLFFPSLSSCHAFLDRKLFSTYTYHPHLVGEPDIEPTAPTNTSSEDLDATTCFGISLSALLECLQLFGADSARERYAAGAPAGGSIVTSSLNRNLIFDQQTLRINGTCRILYEEKGSPLSIILEESGVTTTCELVTYEVEGLEEIPIARDALAQKIIMKAGWLYDAVEELSGNCPDRLVITASPRQPHFSLSSVGSMGSTMVEFTRTMLETFQVPGQIANTYKFSFVKHAIKAMATASKVSIRGDNVGVLSLQFMIDHEGGTPSFIDFRFLPFEHLSDHSGAEDDDNDSHDVT